MKTTQEILAAAKNAVPQLLTLTAEEKNHALLAMADVLEQATAEILAANALDMEAARGHISEEMLDRLALTEGRIADMAKGIREVVALPDPVGRGIAENTLPNGWQVQRISVPMGGIAIIYESRPNVTSDAAALALKAGSACVVRGGKEAYRSAHAIVTTLQRGLAAVGLPETAVNLIEDTTRQSATDMMQAVGYIDLLIPRGGAGLIRSCAENALVPCIQTGTGICHIYVDDSADLEKSLNIIENAKMSRPSVCNAAEVCLVHKDVAAEFLPKLKARLTDPKHPHPAQLRLDERALAIIDGVAATEEDFDTEFLDYVLAVKVVDSTADAIAHIGAHSTHHSDAIITENDTAAQLFTRLVDSAAVYVNASTRFTDGGQFGLGCEMGISTQKLHARGPMGLEELTTYKYVVKGSGQIR